MKTLLVFVAGLALGIATTAACLGRYQIAMTGAPFGSVARLDRWTGQVIGHRLDAREPYFSLDGEKLRTFSD